MQLLFALLLVLFAACNTMAEKQCQYEIDTFCQAVRNQVLCLYELYTKGVATPGCAERIRFIVQDSIDVRGSQNTTSFAQLFDQLATPNLQTPSLSDPLSSVVWVDTKRYATSQSVGRIDIAMCHSPFSTDQTNDKLVMMAIPLQSRFAACHADRYTNEQHINTEFCQWHLAQYIRPGSVAIDIGAHNGDTTMQYALRAGAVLAFEASTGIFKTLADMAVLNPHRNIFAYNLAIFPETGTQTFTYGADDAADCNAGQGQGSRLVHGVNLYEFLQTHHYGDIQRISFIKIDTEGQDPHILRSLAPLLDAMVTKPIIQVEWFRDWCSGPNRHMSQTLFEAINQVKYYASASHSLRFAQEIKLHWSAQQAEAIKLMNEPLPTDRMVVQEDCEHMPDLILKPL